MAGPWSGSGGRGGEIGHLRVDFSADAPICDCGAPGHLAAVASARGVLARARRQALRDPGLSAVARCWPSASAADPQALDTRALVAAYHAGDDWTLALIRDAARPLGQALAGLHLGVGVRAVSS
jgi:glucokinase